MERLVPDWLTVTGQSRRFLGKYIHKITGDRRQAEVHRHLQGPNLFTKTLGTLKTQNTIENETLN